MSAANPETTPPARSGRPADVLAGRATWSLHAGDNRDLLRVLPAGSVDHVITDPPFGVGYESTLGKRVLNDDAPFVWWLKDAFLATRPGGSLLCFTRWDVQEAWRLAITWAGFRVQSQVIWDKLVPGMGDCGAAFAPSHEVVLFAIKGRFKFPGRRPRSVKQAMRPHWKQREHPTQKPVDLMRRLVTAVSKVGEVILDPFAGSGSTGEACLLEGRRFIGAELDQEHAKGARARLLAVSRRRRSEPE